MLKRISTNSIKTGVFGNFLPLGAHIILDYLFEDKEMGGFIYKRKPAMKDFQLFDTIFCSVDIFTKFKTELAKLSEKRRVIVIHEKQETLKGYVADVGIQHLYVCHSQQALIDARHRNAIKEPGSSGYIKK